MHMFLGLMSAFSFLCGAVQAAGPSTAPAFNVDSRPPGEELQFIKADAPELYYIGRIDAREPEAPVFNWQGSEVRANFTGTALGFRFANAWGQNYYNAIIDGRIRLLALKAGGTHDYMLAEPLPDGAHTLILFKRTEAMFSGAAFKGLLLAANGLLAPKPQALPLRLEFYGDSITAGACDEDPGADQYDDFSTHNNYMSYAAITARNLDAEYTNIAVSGTGICYSWNPVLIPDVYDKLYPFKSSVKFVPGGRQPHAVIINLGQNDFGFPNSQGKPFPADFTEKYVKFVQNIRALYPAAGIVCAIGGMSAYRDSKELQAAFAGAVAELQAKDKKVYKYIFQAFTPNHPRVDTHAKLAEELTEFLRKEVLAEAGK